MSQENIWEQSLSGEVKKLSTPAILIKKTFAYPLTDLHLRNYLNTHAVNDIHLDSFYDYFKDNLFQDFKGLYLPHLLCNMPYISYEKIYKALDEVFQVISPNMGSLTEMNYNYFQFFVLIMRKNEMLYLGNKSKELYDLGLKHGLNVLYSDAYYNLMCTYYAAIAPFEDILENYEYLLIPKVEGFNPQYLWNVLKVMEYRFISCYVDDSKEIERKIKNSLIFREMLKYNHGAVGECFSYEKNNQNSSRAHFTGDYNICAEVKQYIKSYINSESAKK